MKLQVLHVPGCPHAALLTARLAELVAGRAEVEQRPVHSQREAESLGMRGSPTLLVDGADPFPAGDQPPSLSCRLYRDETGALTGTPSAAQLREALATEDTSQA